jgi:hypothetical protein
MAREVPADGANVTSKVRITAPGQADGQAVSYTVERAAPLSSLSDPTGFRPGRLVANIQLSKAGAINPPVKIGVELTQGDVDRARGQNFKIGYHNGQQWVTLKDNIPCATGTVEVEMSKVGDPPIGVSP